MIEKEVEKALTHRELTTEIQLIWNVNTKVMPVKIGLNGTISVIQKIREQHTGKT